MVYRGQEVSTGRLTYEKDVFLLGADFDVLGVKFYFYFFYHS